MSCSLLHTQHLQRCYKTNNLTTKVLFVSMSRMRKRELQERQSQLRGRRAGLGHRSLWFQAQRSARNKGREGQDPAGWLVAPCPLHRGRVAWNAPCHPGCREMSEKLSFLCLPPARHISRGTNKDEFPLCLFCGCQEGRLGPERGGGHCQRPLLVGSAGHTHVIALSRDWSHSAPVWKGSLDFTVIPAWVLTPALPFTYYLAT